MTVGFLEVGRFAEAVARDDISVAQFIVCLTKLPCVCVCVFVCVDMCV